MSRHDVTTDNPANLTGADAVPMEQRRRISLALPKLRLQVPEGCCPGFHLHWFRGTPDRISQALNGGYDFVLPDEVHLNNRLVGDDVANSGNTDLGNRVSIGTSGTSDDGKGLRLYLMKIRDEWYEEDQKILGEKQLSIANSLTGGRLKGDQSRETEADIGLRYIDKRAKQAPIPALFRPKPNRRA